jgi:hypothetical protein
MDQDPLKRPPGGDLPYEGFLNTKYFKDAKALRYGSDFYASVRDLKKRMGEISGISLDSLYQTLMGTAPLSTPGATKTVMDRFVFMEPDATSANRLATLVGMYNIHPGADNWLKAKMMNFYKGMMANWRASGRDSYDFINAFVKDRPAMPDTPAKEEVLPGTDWEVDPLEW